MTLPMPCETIWVRETKGPGPKAARKGPSRRIEREQAPDLTLIVHRHVRVDGGRGNRRMSGRVADLGQRPAAGQRVADERVPAVVDRQLPDALGTQHPAGDLEPGGR